MDSTPPSFIGRSRILEIGDGIRPLQRTQVRVSHETDSETELQSVEVLPSVRTSPDTPRPLPGPGGRPILVTKETSEKNLVLTAK